IDFGWGAVLLAFVTAQRIAELWWAGQNERRLFAAGGVEYGRAHLPLMVLLHAAWIVGMWALAYDRAVNLFFCRALCFCKSRDFGCLSALGGAGPSASSSCRASAWWRAARTGFCVIPTMRS